MKKIAIALFTVVALSSCGGGEKCEGNCVDTLAVDSTAAAAVTTSTVTATDTVKTDSVTVK